MITTTTNWFTDEPVVLRMACALVVGVGSLSIATGCGATEASEGGHAPRTAHARDDRCEFEFHGDEVSRRRASVQLRCPEIEVTRVTLRGIPAVVRAELATHDSEGGVNTVKCSKVGLASVGCEISPGSRGRVGGLLWLRRSTKCVRVLTVRASGGFVCSGEGCPLAIAYDVSPRLETRVC